MLCLNSFHLQCHSSGNSYPDSHPVYCCNCCRWISGCWVSLRSGCLCCSHCNSGFGYKLWCLSSCLCPVSRNSSRTGHCGCNRFAVCSRKMCFLHQCILCSYRNFCSCSVNFEYQFLFTILLNSINLP